jgi:hypothetical protein
MAPSGALCPFTGGTKRVESDAESDQSDEEERSKGNRKCDRIRMISWDMKIQQNCCEEVTESITEITINFNAIDRGGGRRWSHFQQVLIIEIQETKMKRKKGKEDD